MIESDTPPILPAVTSAALWQAYSVIGKHP